MSKLSSAKFHSSDLSRFCDEHLGFDFHYLDGDEVILRYSAQPITYARSTRVLRFLESKRPGEEIRRSQREVFPILANLAQLGIDNGIIAEGSGAFILEGEPPYDDGAILRAVLPGDETRSAGLQYTEHRINRQHVEMLVRCRTSSERRAA